MGIGCGRGVLYFSAMEAESRAFLRATLAMLGTIIGAGVFALPLAMQRTGILAGSVVYWTIALVALATHLLYAESILRTKGMAKTRLPGQAGMILGPWWERLAFVSHPLQIMTACLAYIILGGEFLAVLAGAAGVPDSLLVWQAIFWFGGAVTVFFGLKAVAKVEAGMTWALVTAMLAASFLYATRADGRLFFEADWTQGFFPLGIFLFALFGLPVVSEVAELCRRDAERTRLAIAIGTIGAALVMWLFAVFAAAVVNGPLTSPSDLVHGLPPSFAWLIPTVGFFAVATSFITLVQDLVSMLRLDVGFRPFTAWALALGAPIVFLLFITRNFLETVGVGGSIFSSVNGLIVSAMAIAVGRAHPRAMSPFLRLWLPCITAAVFLTAIIWRILPMNHL